MTTVTIDTTNLVERPTVWGNTAQYNMAEIIIPNMATAIAGGAGQAVTTSIAFDGEQPSDTNYTVQAVASQACAVSYTNKAVTGFDLVLTPLSGGVTLAAGTADVIVNWQHGGTQ